MLAVLGVFMPTTLLFRDKGQLEWFVKESARTEGEKAKTASRANKKRWEKEKKGFQTPWSSSLKRVT